jgi:hypothetical protein
MPEVFNRSLLRDGGDLIKRGGYLVTAYVRYALLDGVWLSSHRCILQCSLSQVSHMSLLSHHFSPPTLATRRALITRI